MIILLTANSGFDENGLPAVIITLDGKGASRFSKVTGENVNKLMAVVFIDNKTVTINKKWKQNKKNNKEGRGNQCCAHSRATQ